MLLKKIYIILFTCIFPHFAMAIPTAPEVVSGRASITENMNGQLQVNCSSERTYIRWDDFSIGQEENVTILQPSTDSATLIEVKTSTPSTLNGSLTSNGTIYLVNKKGIVMDVNSNISCNGFYALGAGVNTGQFSQKQEMRANGICDCDIIQRGNISASGKDVLFLARKIVNEGIIEAPNGNVLLASGTRFMGAVDGLGLHVRSTPLRETKNREQIGIVQSGQISGRLVRYLADGSIYEVAICHSGSTTALNIGTQQSGEVLFYSQNGKIETQGQLIGSKKVHLLGNEITIGQNTSIQSFTSMGGGEVLIGGDYQGANPSILNASKTYFDATARVDVSAQDSGNGGRVIIWGTDSSQFYGTILARGGAQQGNGGFVEVSSKGVLDFQGVVDRLAPHGNAGTLLLDPSDIVISPANPDSNIMVGSTITATASSAVLSLGTLNAQLLMGNVIVSTTSSFSGNGDITTDGEINEIVLSGNTLTLNAERDIVLTHALVYSSKGGTFNLNAGRDYVQSAVGPGLSRVRLQASSPFLAQVPLNITAVRDVIFELSPDNTGFCQVDTFGPLTITAGRDVTINNLSNLPTTSDSIFVNVDSGQGSGDVLIKAGRNFSASAPQTIPAMVEPIGLSGKNYTIIAQNNVFFGPGVTTKNVFDEIPDSFTVVCDNENPNTPFIGLNGLTIEGDHIIFTTTFSNQLRFFTARRNQNFIGSNVLFNNATFVPGPIFVTSPTEKWLTWYPSSYGGVPFTIFYKNGFVCPPSNLTGKANTDQFVGQKEYNVTLKWDPSSCSDVVAYNVFVNGELVKTIPASGHPQATIH
ncbi:MAG TPA: filamentous hemagglutinin N-terminal domain-containing protein, partial [Rhabdochlamydiaceae bacterium]|nr:filamentous hemagglutinin N-terminal domain-containing protein [Rhabdochlamydiaceae bacterium]